MEMRQLMWMLAMVWVLNGCNTIHGMGQDIQKGGEKVQQAAKNVQQKL